MHSTNIYFYWNRKTNNGQLVDLAMTVHLDQSWFENFNKVIVSYVFNLTTVPQNPLDNCISQFVSGYWPCFKNKSITTSYNLTALYKPNIPTTQNSVVWAKFWYSSIVERTLRNRQARTMRKLSRTKRKKNQTELIHIGLWTDYFSLYRIQLPTVYDHWKRIKDQTI